MKKLSLRIAFLVFGSVMAVDRIGYAQVGCVTGVTITNAGSGYTAGQIGAAVTFTGGGGSGATAVISSIAGGSLTGVNITNPGSGYTSAPTVTIPPPATAGITATATATIGPCPTKTPTNTPTNTPTSTPTNTPTSTPTNTPTNTPTTAVAVVPTLNESGMLIFGLLIAAAGLLLLVRRR